jgi:uncharacterized glyoxalase superfamily protein PhnB
MEDGTTTRTQDVTPMLDYEDGPAAMDWLAKAFGFVEVTRMFGSDGRLSHGEMIAGAGGGHIMLASLPHYENPCHLRERYAPAQAWLAVPWVIDGVLVYVDDVDAHFARAKAAGARILTEPEDGFPARRYRTEDIEGHRWMFMEQPRPSAED